MIRRLANLITVKEKGSFLLFLGAGASIESGGPRTEEIVNSVVRDFGDDALSGTTQRYEEFYRTLGRLGRGDRHAIFARYFQGMAPSQGYLQLAQLIDEEYFDVILTTNFDNMLEQAFAARGLSRGSDYILFIVSMDRGEEIRYFLSQSRPRIKIIKLHGDLASGVLYFSPEETYGFTELITENLRDLTTRNMIFIGYRGVDRSVLGILNREGDSIWWVNPSALDWNDQEERHILTILHLRRSADNLISVSDGHFDAFVARLCGRLGV